jgi:hypothetical protein
MSRILSFILLLSIFTPAVAKYGYLVYFFTNRTAIAEKYCINKDKKDVKCDGLCHLRTQISLLDIPISPAEPESSLPALKNFELPVFFCKLPIDSLLITVLIREMNTSPIQLYIEPDLFLLHPPPQATC